MLLSGTGDVHRSDDGSSWTERGLADGWPEVASSATQLAHSWETLPLGTESDVIYDVSVGADGSLWAAGCNEVFRIGP